MESTFIGEFRTDLHEISLISARSEKSWSGHNKLTRKSSTAFHKKPRRQGSAYSTNRKSECDSSGVEVSNEDVEHLPPLLFETSDMREAALSAKLKQCFRVCNFNEVNKDTKSKEVKRVALNDICDFLSWHFDSLDHSEIYEDLFQFFAVNLFRDLPPVKEVCPLELILVEVEEDDPIKDVAWPHLQLVYAIFLTVIQSPKFDPELASEYLNEEFVFKLLQLFESYDSRERELLQSVIYNIYLKMIYLRACIRKQIAHVFLMFVEGNRSPNGVAELLDMMSSVICGFAVPIKQEHQQFLYHVLIPLHRPRSLPLYHESLTLCMTQFLERDESLVDEMMNRLLPLWPRIQTAKSIKFINEVEGILEKVHNYDKENQAWLCLLARKVASCIQSDHSLVAERALTFANGQLFFDFLKPHALRIIPLLFPALYHTSRTHWSATVTSLAFKLLTHLMRLNSELFDYLVDIQSGNELKLTEQNHAESILDQHIHSIY